MKWAFQSFAVPNPAVYAEWAPYGLKTFISACEGKGGFGQIVDAKYVCSEKHVSLAVANGLESISEGSVQSRSPSIELLLRLAGKRQFVDAVKMGVDSTTKTLIVIAVVPNSPGALITDWSKNQPFKKHAINWNAHLTQNEKSLISFFNLQSVNWPKAKKERLELLEKLVLEKVAITFL